MNAFQACAVLTIVATQKIDLGITYSRTAKQPYPNSCRRQSQTLDVWNTQTCQKCVAMHFPGHLNITVNEIPMNIVDLFSD